jgi:hypothetical protein
MKKVLFREVVPEPDQKIDGTMGDPGMVTVSMGMEGDKKYLHIIADDGYTYMVELNWSLNKALEREDVKTGDRTGIQWTGKEWR